MNRVPLSLLLLLVLLSSACVTTKAALLGGAVARDAKAVESVAFYTSAPARAHWPLALIEARGPMGAATMDLVAAAREEAGRMGADAIVAGSPQTEQVSPGGAVMLPMPGQGPIALAAGPGGAKVLYVTAICWY